MTIQFMIFGGFNVYITVDLVKCCVFTLVCDTRSYRNDRHYCSVSLSC